MHSADVYPAAMQSLLDHGRGGLTRVYCNNPYDKSNMCDIADNTVLSTGSNGFNRLCKDA